MRLIALFMLAATACAPLDRRPPFRSAGYLRSITSVRAAVRGADPHTGRYHVGWARRPILAPPAVPLAGYGARRGALSTGLRDQPYVRAFAINAGGRTAVIFTADLLSVDERLTAAVRTGLSELDGDTLFFTVSHTHSGPGGYMPGLLYELGFGAFDPRALNAVIDAHVQAARQAVATMAPARVGSAEINVPGLAKNRVERDGATDDALFVLSFEADDGRRAAFWSFGCHAVLLPASSRVLSADYPGAVAAAFENQRLEVLGFAAGGIGSTDPLRQGADMQWLTDPLVEGLRRGLAQAQASAQSSGRVAMATAVIPRPPMRYRFLRDWMVAPPLAEAIVPTATLDVSAIAVGDNVLLFMPAELSGQLTRTVRRAARRRGYRMAVLALNGTYAGYVVPHRVYELPADAGADLFVYETQRMAFMGPWGADLLLNVGLRLAAGVRARR